MIATRSSGWKGQVPLRAMMWLFTSVPFQNNVLLVVRNDGLDFLRLPSFVYCSGHLLTTSLIHQIAVLAMQYWMPQKGILTFLLWYSVYFNAPERIQEQSCTECWVKGAVGQNYSKTLQCGVHRSSRAASSSPASFICAAVKRPAALSQWVSCSGCRNLPAYPPPLRKRIRTTLVGTALVVLQISRVLLLGLSTVMTLFFVFFFFYGFLWVARQIFFFLYYHPPSPVIIPFISESFTLNFLNFPVHNVLWKYFPQC